MTSHSENSASGGSVNGPETKQWEKVLFVYNPVAGKSEIKTELADIVGILSGDSRLVTCYPTKCRGDARDFVSARPEDYAYVVCAGGDGTLDEVVSGMMESPVRPVVPIGYIPTGTTNDFASSLGISSNKKEAAKIAVQGKVMECDLGRFNKNMLFTYVAAFGLFTESSYETPQDLKNMLGHMAYVMQGLIDLGKTRTYHFRVESDELSVSDEFVYGMVTNSRSVGGIADITGSKVDMGDGLFEVTLIKMPANPLELSDILSYLSHLTDTSDLVYQFKTSHIVLESTERVKWTRDGEYAGTFKRVELTNLHKALKILVPRENK